VTLETWCQLVDWSYCSTNYSWQDPIANTRSKLSESSDGGRFERNAVFTVIPLFSGKKILWEWSTWHRFYLSFCHLQCLAVFKNSIYLISAKWHQLKHEMNQNDVAHTDTTTRQQIRNLNHCLYRPDCSTASFSFGTRNLEHTGIP
jgi:hypothetical protein